MKRAELSHLVQSGKQNRLRTALAHDHISLKWKSDPRLHGSLNALQALANLVVRSRSAL